MKYSLFTFEDLVTENKTKSQGEKEGMRDQCSWLRAKATATKF